MADKVFVDEVEEFGEGEYRTVFKGNTDIAVFNVEGQFYAIEDVCTHDGGVLTGGTVDGEEVECPRHQARFNIKTGEALTPPAFEDVDTFKTEVEDGQLYVYVE
jgi:3-phenylpropionate/trans-cinnamate dioxygenase ferredoxin subunit